MRNGFRRNFREGSLIISHDDFVLGYQNGELGCSLSTLLILRLFLVGRVRETRVVIALVGWSLVSLLLFGLTIIGFLCLPAVWALLGTIMLLGIFALAFVDQVGWLIVSTALIDEDFYQFALAERALYVFTDGRVIILALQGGGALGAYQAGVYRAMTESQLEPDWVTGISIGSINGSLIAGNKVGSRLEHVTEFWDRVKSPERPWNLLPNPFSNITDSWEIARMLTTGQRNFFQPWPVPPFLSPPGTPSATSLYSTEPLRKTLTDLIDLEVLGKNGTRLSLGATKIFGGELHFFDSKHDKLSVEHIMASGAFPPYFPPIEIDGNAYWDGGVIANTSVRFLAHEIKQELKQKLPAEGRLLVIAVNLWQSFNPNPKTLDEVNWSIKQIQFSSGVEIELRELANELSLYDDGASLAGRKIDVCIVNYKSVAEEIPFGDGDFSYAAIERRIDQGYADMRHVIHDNAFMSVEPVSPKITGLSAPAGDVQVHEF